MVEPSVIVRLLREEGEDLERLNCASTGAIAEILCETHQDLALKTLWIGTGSPMVTEIRSVCYVP